MENKKLYEFTRYLKIYDDKGRLVDYKVIEATKDPAVIDLMKREIDKNKELIKEEQEQEKKIMEHKKFFEDYSIRNFLITGSYAMPRGLISFEKRKDFDAIVNIEDPEERSKQIKAFVTDPVNEKFAKIFNIVREK